VSLAELTDPDAVLSGPEELRRFERDSFLKTYGFKPARTWVGGSRCSTVADR
jgi:hypothetical protein